MPNLYEIIPTEDQESEFQSFVVETKIPGYLHPNNPEGLVYHLEIDKEMATMLSLRFRLKSIRRLDSKSKTCA